MSMWTSYNESRTRYDIVVVKDAKDVLCLLNEFSRQDMIPFQSKANFYNTFLCRLNFSEQEIPF